MQSSFQRRPDGQVVCRFTDGQEARARAFLERGPASAPLRSRVWPAALTMGGGVFGLFVVTGPFSMWLTDDMSWAFFRMLLLVGAGMGISLVLFVLWVGTSTWWRPERGELEHGGTYSFATLSPPRRSRFRTQGTEGGLHGISTSPRTYETVEVTTDDGNTLRVGRGGDTSMNRLAADINEMVFEFHERAAVRDWLRDRERQLAQGKSPYRSS